MTKRVNLFSKPTKLKKPIGGIEREDPRPPPRRAMEFVMITDWNFDQQIERPEERGCLCGLFEKPDGILHVCSYFTKLTLLSKAQTGGIGRSTNTSTRRKAKETGQPEEGGPSKRRKPSRYRLEDDSDPTLVAVDHGDAANTLQEWVECYSYHKLAVELLPARSNTTTKHLVEPIIDELWSGKGVGIVTGRASNGLVDVVANSSAARSLAQCFLPETQRIHGRNGSPKRHWWYEKFPFPSTGTFKDPDGETLVEIRSDGCATLVPPSVHESGEPILWRTGYPIRTLPCRETDTLEESVRNLAACSLLVKRWPKTGSGVEFALVVAETLLRNGKSADFTKHFVIAAAYIAARDEGRQIQDALSRFTEELAGDTRVTCNFKLADIIGENETNCISTWLGLTPAESTTSATGQAESEEASDSIPDPKHFDSPVDQRIEEAEIIGCPESVSASEGDFDLEHLAEGFHFSQGCVSDDNFESCANPNLFPCTHLTRIVHGSDRDE